MTFSKASTALLERSLSLDSRCHNLPAEVALDVAVVFHREFNSVFTLSYDLGRL